MTESAGIKDADQPVCLGGAVFQQNPLMIQGWNYYGLDFMNTACMQADYTCEHSESMDAILSAQAADQRSVGEELGGDFQTGMVGFQEQIRFRGLKIALGYTY